MMTSVVTALTIDDLDAYVEHFIASSAESGRDGDPYSGPYGRDEPVSADEIRAKTRARWTSDLDKPGWRRAWGVYDGLTIIASGNVAGGEMPAAMHRVMLGMGVLRPHRRRGHGARILETIIDWCRTQPSIDWLDLGVFADNRPARALYEQYGFEVVGRVVDRWRVDGYRIEEVQMTLELRL